MRAFLAHERGWSFYWRKLFESCGLSRLGSIFDWLRQFPNLKTVDHCMGWRSIV
jgi:hypothetical protein